MTAIIARLPLNPSPSPAGSVAQTSILRLPRLAFSRVMARERPQRTGDELIAMSRHVLYEIEMLAHTASWLYTIIVVPEDGDPKTRSSLRNAMLESWALHLRNLLSFLYDDRPGKGAAVSADFVDGDWEQLRGEPPPVLRLARAKASKEIAHLLYERAKLSDEQRTWHLGPILVELSKVLHRFLESVPGARLQPDFRERAFAALPYRGVTMSPHGLSVASSSMISLVEFKKSIGSD